MQEVEINMDYDHEILSFSGYSLLIESNDDKSRSGIYVKNGINYERRTDLEQRNNGIVILDITWLKSWPNIKFIEIMTISLTIDQIDQNPT